MLSALARVKLSGKLSRTARAASSGDLEGGPLSDAALSDSKPESGWYAASGPGARSLGRGLGRASLGRGLGRGSPALAAGEAAGGTCFRCFPDSNAVDELSGRRSR